MILVQLKDNTGDNVLKLQIIVDAVQKVHRDIMTTVHHFYIYGKKDSNTGDGKGALTFSKIVGSVAFDSSRKRKSPIAKKRL